MEYKCWKDSVDANSLGASGWEIDQGRNQPCYLHPKEVNVNRLSTNLGGQAALKLCHLLFLSRRVDEKSLPKALEGFPGDMAWSIMKECLVTPQQTRYHGLLYFKQVQWQDYVYWTSIPVKLPLLCFFSVRSLDFLVSSRSRLAQWPAGQERAAPSSRAESGGWTFDQRRAEAAVAQPES